MTNPPEKRATPLPYGFAAMLLRWYGREGRDLPWRKTRDPYRIWISEIMLQQTGVGTVIPYYEKFLARFPDLYALADAPLDDVIEKWAGLGYYSRARNLHAAAITIRNRFGGRLPSDLENLMSLPGIGRSSAGAILAIAFNRKAPILDGNVRRILCRIFAVSEEPRSPAAEKKLWQWAGELTPEERPHDYSQAIMDLGATLCTPSNPACDRCPVANCCLAHKLGKTEELPVRSRRKPLPQRREVALVLVRQGRYLVRQRPYRGMLGGLWEFPSLELDQDREPGETAEKLLTRLGVEGILHARGKTRHVYSHFRLESEVFSAEVDSQAGMIHENSQSSWVPVAEVGSLPMHGAHKKVLQLFKIK